MQPSLMTALSDTHHPSPPNHNHAVRASSHPRPPLFSPPHLRSFWVPIQYNLITFCP
ncbi:hypothetical protein BJ165DRAFT_1447541 [Panaeolus papilionaceus]|nr:hypothetical protein BJ165DRAFT_1486951 [Panaeolus papilionaceus]KAF9053452.1 hypothetical protein BJ165DRAFT_1447541 [Panaeolus papilionaceus]